nr:hypothetical protein [uncultured Flavobacterium sp.]
MHICDSPMHIHDIAMHIHDIGMRIHDIAMHICDSPIRICNAVWSKKETGKTTNSCILNKRNLQIKTFNSR